MADHHDPSKAIIAAALIQDGHLKPLDDEAITQLCTLAEKIHAKLYFPDDVPQATKGNEPPTTPTDLDMSVGRSGVQPGRADSQGRG